MHDRTNTNPESTPQAEHVSAQSNDNIATLSNMPNFDIDCPIGLRPMRDPMIVHVNGKALSYERVHIAEYISRGGNKDPVQQKPIHNSTYYPNRTLKNFIESYTQITVKGRIPLLQLQAELKPLERHFICPITQRPMHKPVVASDGCSYEEEALEAYLHKYGAESLSPIQRGVRLDRNVKIENLVLKNNQEILNDSCKIESKDAPLPAQKLDCLIRLAHCKAALLYDPNNAAAFHNQGIAFHDLGDKEQALASYKQSLLLRPNDGNTLYNHGLILNQMGRHEEALASVEASLRVHPGDAMALHARGSILLDLSRFEEALKSITASLQVRPQHARTLYSQGMALLETEQYEQAAASFKAVLAIDPVDCHAFLLLGHVFDKLHQVELALKNTEAALNISPNWYSALSNRGYFLSLLGRNKEALASVDAALVQNPQHKPTHLIRAFILNKLERHDDAYRSYKTFYSLSDPEYERMYFIGRPIDHVKSLILKKNIAAASFNPWRLFGEVNPEPNEEKLLPDNCRPKGFMSGL